MALIDLKSNLKKSNVYKDTPGGGNSGLPYIKQGLPEDSPAGEYLAGIARSSLDTNIRGGLYSTIASEEDTVRISRFLTDFPRGVLFTSKQIGLQKSNPLIETEQRGSTIGTDGLTIPTINTRVYSNSNLLAQVALQGTGEHVPRAGFNTNNLLQDINKYESIVTGNNNTGKNRLVTLYNSKINLDPSSTDISSDLTKLGISKDENVLFNYGGGPGSSYGDGNTFIGRAVNTNESWEIYKTAGYSTSGYSPKDTITFENRLLDDPYASQIIASDKFNKYLKGVFIPTTTYIFDEPPKTPQSVKHNLDPEKEITDAHSFASRIRNENLKVSTNPNPNYSKNRLNGDNVDLERFVSYQQTSQDFIRPLTVPTNMSTNNKFGNTMAYDKLLSAKSSNEIVKGPLQEVIDFRNFTIDPNDPARSQARNYSTESVNITTRVGIGNPGARTRDQRKYINDVNNGIGQDKVNMIPLYTDATNPFQTSKYGSTDNGGNGDARDLIKFAFEVIDNDGGTGNSGFEFTGKDKKQHSLQDTITTKVHFRAFLTNFSDNHSADWASQKYMGRGENLYAYQGFQREVSFQFKVAAQSKQEMMPLYQKLNYIVSSLYPDYNSQGFMRGNLHKLTIGEYFYRTPGIITSMNIIVDDNYPWEIKYNEPETSKGLNATDQFSDPSNNFPGTQKFQNSNSDADMMELPQVLNVQVTFKPILNELPSLSKHRGDSGNDRRGILISNDVGKEENFINRIYNKPPPAKDFSKTFKAENFQLASIKKT